MLDTAAGENASTVRCVGENGMEAPAPAKIVAPGAGLFVFHMSVKVTLYPLTTVVVSTKAALGEKVPPKPPLSFHAPSCPGPPPSIRKMPMSWLKPAFAVHRSAPALTRTVSQ